VAATALLGCGEARGPDPAWTAGDAWTVGEPTVTSAQGAGTDFFRVAGAARLSDGRLVVADEGSSEVRFFAPDGTHLLSVGGRGEGPGEFALIQSMGPAGGDSVWVYDYGAARITVLAPDGAIARTIPVTPPLPAGILVGRRSDGSFVLAQMWGTGDPWAPVPEGLVRETAVVAAYDANGRLRDTLARVPGREVFQRLEDGRMTMGVVPFARTASHALWGDDLVVGDQVDRVLEVLGPRGVAVRDVRWSGPPLDVTEEDVDRWGEGQVAAAPAVDRASVRARLAVTPFPDRRPAYGRLLPDAGGCLWVAAYAEPGQAARRWDVLDGRGRRLGSLTLPPRFRLHQIGRNWLLGVARDDLDVERVEVRPLRRPSPPGC